MYPPQPNHIYDSKSYCSCTPNYSSKLLLYFYVVGFVNLTVLLVLIVVVLVVVMVVVLVVVLVVVVVVVVG